MTARNRAFTLIELMIVVAIVGVLAVLAVYGVRKYMTKTKASEAQNSLGQMAKDQSAAFEREIMGGGPLGPGSGAGMSRSLCASPSVSVPSSIGFVKGQKYQSSQVAGVDWNADEATMGMGFSCLRFTMDAPQYYMYNFKTTTPTAAGGTWVGTANGDLNGDGSVSTYQLNGIIQTSMTFSIAPNMIEFNPDD